jgi:hypothetical protein
MKVLLAASILLYITPVTTGTVINEHFNSLSAWTPLTFPEIKRHTVYSIARNRKGSYLTSKTGNSASGLLYNREFSIYKTPHIQWRWKISNVYKKGNGRRKSGEDYPVRIYILFKYNPSGASLPEKIQYNTLKLIYGKYPPHSSLSYVWANIDHGVTIFTSPYSGRSTILVKQKGGKHRGRWIREKANILEDYKKAFGKLPPKTAGLAVMSDSDNTGERATAYIDYIKISGKSSP